jgi:hypothetical protein
MLPEEKQGLQGPFAMLPGGGSRDLYENVILCIMPQ